MKTINNYISNEKISSLDEYISNEKFSSLDNYIIEKLRIGKNTISSYEPIIEIVGNKNNQYFSEKLIQQITEISNSLPEKPQYISNIISGSTDYLNDVIFLYFYDFHDPNKTGKTIYFDIFNGNGAITIKILPTATINKDTILIKLNRDDYNKYNYKEQLNLLYDKLLEKLYEIKFFDMKN